MGCPRLASADDKILNLYAWTDYFDPDVLDDFTRETGIKVAYDTYDTSETLEARLALGHSGSDVIVLSGPALEKQIAARLLQRLDKDRLPNAKAVWPEIAARLAIYDPGNLYALNYMWFTLGLTYKAATLQDRHDVASLASWDAIFRPELLKKFADCGVEVQDSPYELFALALHYLRLDPRSKSLLDLKRASELLYSLRRNVKRFQSAVDVADLAGGDACLMLGWSSDAAQAQKQALESGSGVAIDFAAPKGGTLVLLDNLAIPKDAPHLDAAYAFINFLMRPEIAARNTKATHFANGILASRAFLPQEILADPSIYPDEATMKSFFVMAAYGPDEQAFIQHEWARVKFGDVKPSVAKDAKPPVKKTEKARNHAGRGQQ